MPIRAGASSIRPRSALILVCAAVLMHVAGCGRSDEKARSDIEARITRTAQGGPVSMTLSLEPAEPVASEPATVRLDVVAKAGVTVSVDDYERALREAEDHFDYRILGSDRQLARPMGDGTLRWSYAWRLEFVLPGDFELPAAALSYVDPSEKEGETAPTRESDAPEPRALSTETLTLVVREAATPTPSPEELAQIDTLQPVELPRRLNWWWAAVAVVFIACIVLLIAWIRRRRAQQAERVIVIPAHEWAQRELAALVAEDLMAQGRVQDFYYRISDIVRGYVERRFHVSAPEMTTEEFLATASADVRFGETNTRELERFLAACDMVKYARQVPGSDESMQLVSAAQTFVDRTRDRHGDSSRALPATSAGRGEAA